MLSDPLICCFFFSLLLCTIARNYFTFNPELLFDSPCPLHFPQVYQFGNETTCISNIWMWRIKICMHTMQTNVRTYPKRIKSMVYMNVTQEKLVFLWSDAPLEKLCAPVLLTGWTWEKKIHYIFQWLLLLLCDLLKYCFIKSHKIKVYFLSRKKQVPYPESTVYIAE